MSSNFGIDLMFETQRANIQSENDVLIILVHWILTKNDFRNVGLGDNKVFSDEDRPSELLPTGWNQDQTAYTLRYTMNQQIYILHGIVSGDTLLVNVLDGKTLKTASVVLKTKDIVKSKTGVAFNDYVSDAQPVIDQLSKDIVKAILAPAPEAESNQNSRSTSVDPLLVQPPRHPVVPPMYYDPTRDPLRDPLRDIGRGDLDPFGRGGGMIFRPERPRIGPHNPLLPGRLPPGARYDPPNPFGIMDPDNDHLPPPGYPPRPGNPPPGYDDMFM